MFWHTVKTVAAAFFGVRSRNNAESKKLSPIMVIATGFLLAFVLLIAVWAVVKLLLAQQG